VEKIAECEQLASTGRSLLAGSLYLNHNGVPAALRTNVAAREISESHQFLVL